MWERLHWGARSFVTVDGVNQSIRVLPGAVIYSGLGNVSNASNCIVNSIYCDGSTTLSLGSRVFMFNSLYGGNGESKFNALTNSYLVGRIIQGSGTPYVEDVIEVGGNAHHNLIGGNSLLTAHHSVINIGSVNPIDISHDNVIRNNVISTTHNSALGSYGKGPASNVFEGNTVSATAANSAYATEDHYGNSFQISGSNNIIRRNVISKGGPFDPNLGHSGKGGLMLNVGGGGGSNTSFNRIYNNTIVKNNAKAVAVQDFNVGPAGPVRVLSNNKFVNNFVYGYLAPGSYNELLLYWDQLQNTNDRWINNVFGNSGGSATELIIENKTGSYNLAGAIAPLLKPVNPEFTSWNGFNNVYNANPGFTNYAGDDFTLPVGNTYINAGAHLTNVRTGDSGSGTTLLVDDAQFFEDGKGIPGVVGDQIAIGSVTTTRQITAVNYSTNTITLSSSVTRAVGNKIWLYAGSSGNVVLNGSAPDYWCV